MSRIYSVEEAPTERAAIVFGAGLSRSGRPTAILRDRIETAARLYSSGKVEKLLMSGGEWSLCTQRAGGHARLRREPGRPSARRSSWTMAGSAPTTRAIEPRRCSAWTPPCW